MCTDEAPSSLPVRHDLLLGVLAGLLAMVVTGAVDRSLDRLVSPAQKRRDRSLREGTPHEVAGPRFAEAIVRRPLTPAGQKRARTAFSVAYGVGWGLVYTLVRRRLPAVSRVVGLPFAVPFFVACDGLIAPSLGLTPAMTKVPWQLNAKELANHAAWTATTELGRRWAGRWAR